MRNGTCCVSYFEDIVDVVVVEVVEVLRVIEAGAFAPCAFSKPEYPFGIWAGVRLPLLNIVWVT